MKDREAVRKAVDKALQKEHARELRFLNRALTLTKVMKKLLIKSRKGS